MNKTKRWLLLTTILSVPIFPYASTGKNIIFFIGDGMGSGHTSQAADYKGSPLFFQSEAKITGFQVTDSLDSNPLREQCNFASEKTDEKKECIVLDANSDPDQTTQYMIDFLLQKIVSEYNHKHKTRLLPHIDLELIKHLLITDSSASASAMSTGKKTANWTGGVITDHQEWPLSLDHVLKNAGEYMSDSDMEEINQSKETIIAYISDGYDGMAAYEAIKLFKLIFNHPIFANDLFPPYQKAEHITEYLQNKNYVTSLITTKQFTDSTPASFSAHYLSDDDEQTIANQQAQSKINLIIGQQKKDISLNAFHGNSWKVVNNLESAWENIDAEQLLFIHEDNYSIKTLTEFAISFSEKKLGHDLNYQHLFIMSEEGKIDSFAHRNQIDNVINRIQALDEAVEYTAKWAADKASDGHTQQNTLIAVTSDHETGGYRPFYTGKNKLPIAITNQASFKNTNEHHQPEIIAQNSTALHTPETWNSQSELALNTQELIFLNNTSPPFPPPPPTLNETSTVPSKKDNYANTNTSLGNKNPVLNQILNITALNNHGKTTYMIKQQMELGYPFNKALSRVEESAHQDNKSIWTQFGGTHTREKVPYYVFYYGNAALDPLFYLSDLQTKKEHMDNTQWYEFFRLFVDQKIE